MNKTRKSRLIILRRQYWSVGPDWTNQTRSRTITNSISLLLRSPDEEYLQCLLNKVHHLHLNNCRFFSVLSGGKFAIASGRNAFLTHLPKHSYFYSQTATPGRPIKTTAFLTQRKKRTVPKTWNPTTRTWPKTKGPANRIGADMVPWAKMATVPNIITRPIRQAEASNLI